MLGPIWPTREQRRKRAIGAIQGKADQRQVCPHPRGERSSVARGRVRHDAVRLAIARRSAIHSRSTTALGEGNLVPAGSADNTDARLSKPRSPCRAGPLRQSLATAGSAFLRWHRRQKSPAPKSRRALQCAASAPTAAACHLLGEICAGIFCPPMPPGGNAGRRVVQRLAERTRAGHGERGFAQAAIGVVSGPRRNQVSFASRGEVESECMLIVAR